MLTKTNRAPLALALATLMVATLVPVSGADASPAYLFKLGGPGEPRWTMLKLDVQAPGISPILTYETSQMRCPMEWGTHLLTGSPGATLSYNGFIFNWAVGSTGVDGRIQTPLLIARQQVAAENDGVESCSWTNFTANYGEMPVGTVYLLQYAAGIPFPARSALTFDAPGVAIVGVSSGTTVTYVNGTEFLGDGAEIQSPPFCGGIFEQTDCDPNHVNPGGTVGASAGVERWVTKRFKHHPIYFFSEDGSVEASNASMTYPDGRVRHARSNDEAGPLTLNGQGLMDFNLTDPSGWYKWQYTASASVGLQAGWHLTMADVWFPEEVR